MTAPARARKAPARKAPLSAAQRKRAAAEAAKGAPVEAAPYSDALIDEARALLPPVDDAPALLKLHQMRRRERATVTARLELVLPALDRIIEKQKAKVEISPTEWTELLADIEDLLIDLAVDADSMQQWVTDADDEHLIALIAKFSGAISSGEAPSSSS